MHLSSDVQIPDGLLAANALLVENSRQGFETYSGTVQQGFEVAIFSTSLGISNPLYDGRVRSRCTGKERDTESGNDYFGARYYASSMGRMMSPDPHTGTLLHMLNPQRWNMYAYALNNPLLFTDPTGMDAIVVNTTSSAFGLGHLGIVSAHKDGTATYGEFGPVHNGLPIDKGKVDVRSLNTKLAFGQDGKPTQDSMAALKKELAGIKDKPADDIRLIDYPTTDAEASNLDNFMNLADLTGEFSDYNVTGWLPWDRDCRSFTEEGLINAGVHGIRTPFSLGLEPNLLFNWLSFQQEPQGKGTLRILPGFTPVGNQ